MNFQALLSSDATLELVQKKCRDNFSDQNDQDECYLFILDELAADNYRRLSKYSRKSRITTYVAALVNNLVIDFRRKKYGRRRFPALIKRLGEWAQAVYRYVCWQKFTYADAYDFVQVDNLYTGSWDDFLSDVEEIRTAPCAQNPQFVSAHANEDDLLENTPARELNPLDTLIENLDRETKSVAVEVVQDTLNAMPKEDRLLIRLIYGSDHKTSQAAKVLGISRQQAVRRLKSLLLAIKENLLKKGIRWS
jgi:RNA polymerase sigma factor (sigma-70 family)